MDNQKKLLRIKLIIILEGFFILFLTSILIIFGILVNSDKTNAQEIIIKNNDGYYSIKSGKNVINFQESIYVKDLIKKYPMIESISFYDNINNKTIGYVNVYNGVGINFLIENDKYYELNSKFGFNLYL